MLLKEGQILEGWRYLTDPMKKTSSKLRSAGTNCAAFCRYVLKDEKLAQEVCKHIVLRDRYFPYG